VVIPTQTWGGDMGTWGHDEFPIPTDVATVKKKELSPGTLTEVRHTTCKVQTQFSTFNHHTTKALR